MEFGVKKLGSASNMSFGCEHYRRKVKLLAPCCGKIYTCRFCHNSKEDHELDRKSVQSVECMHCGQRQRVRLSCSRCRTRFGEYFCQKCRLYDDENKGQFHCDSCGICRIGGRASFTHCPNCNMCYNNLIIDTHKCIKNSGTDNCGLCLEPLHTSTINLAVPKCGHLIHEKCRDSLKNNQIHTCPTCRAVFEFAM